MTLVLWVDSDPNVQAWEPSFRAAGLEMRFIPEVQELLDFYVSHQEAVTAICTSTMRRGGREERGLPDAFELANRVVALRANLSYKPLLAFITASADEQVVLEHGFSIYQYGNRKAFVRKVIELLTTSSDRDFRMSREVNKCGLHMLSSGFCALQAALRLDPDCKESFAAYHNSFADLCFCAQCQPERTIQRGGEIYAVPTGWMGFGILLRNDLQLNRSHIENWPVVYHGFSPQCLHFILEERRLMFPGDTLKNGTKLQVRLNQCWANEMGSDPVVYVSPTIRYSSHQLYAVPMPFRGQFVQFVLQCRIMPNSPTKCVYRKFRETVDGPGITLTDRSTAKGSLTRISQTWKWSG